MKQKIIQLAIGLIVLALIAWIATMLVPAFATVIVVVALVIALIILLQFFAGWPIV